ncbi:hypothetical protein F5Y01DRAFT_297891 [Xylaria sp. FL0043]|nr:hypothetical protein F5Y01DRAFT_297891 [Xylaria sp. FL0043]
MRDGNSDMHWWGKRARTENPHARGVDVVVVVVAVMVNHMSSYVRHLSPHLTSPRAVAVVAETQLLKHLLGFIVSTSYFPTKGLGGMPLVFVTSYVPGILELKRQVGRRSVM